MWDGCAKYDIMLLSFAFSFINYTCRDRRQTRWREVVLLQPQPRCRLPCQGWCWCGSVACRSNPGNIRNLIFNPWWSSLHFYGCGLVVGGFQRNALLWLKNGIVNCQLQLQFICSCTKEILFCYFNSLFVCFLKKHSGCQHSINLIIINNDNTNRI